MKNIVIMALLVLGCFVHTTAQNSDTTKVTNVVKEPMNMMDTQAKMYSGIFADLGGGAEFENVDSFMELVNNMDASPEIKEKLTEQFNSYRNSLTSKEKDSLKVELKTLLQKAKKDTNN
tara:strand:- start:153955 stop:154311 length:357 start_codon:yes stop_codon:yes gene_type:complete